MGDAMLAFLRRLRARIRYRRFDADLKEELRVHRAMAEDAWRESGRDPADVRHLAARDLGNTTLAREHVRGVWLAPGLESVWQDVVYAIRALRRSPGFTLPVLAVLVITMGMTTSLYATVRTVLFRPWPVDDAAHVVDVRTRRDVMTQTGRITLFGVPPVEYRYLRGHTRSLDLVALGLEYQKLGLDPSSQWVRFVSGNAFRVFRIPMGPGRGLDEADDRPSDASAVVVISDTLWRDQFARSPSAIGSPLRIGGVPFTIVGVTDRRFQDVTGHQRPLAWITVSAGERLATDAARCCLDLAGRLTPGASVERANAELSAAASEFARANGREASSLSATGTAMINDPDVRVRAGRLFALIGAAVGLVLLLGCANVGNLQLARGLSRRRDLTIRLALGASRRRIVRQLLTESLLLCAVGAAGSVWLARILPNVLMRVSDPQGAERFNLSPDASVIAFACALTMITCLISGLAPAMKATRLHVADRAAGPTRTRLRAVLLTVQVAISTTLLIGAGLLTRGLYHAAVTQLGFNPYGVAAVSIGPADADSSLRQAELGRMLARARELGLGPVGATAFVPFGTYNASYEIRLPQNGDRKYRAVTHHVSAGYFDALGMSIVAGRVFSPGATDEVVVNESFARLLWPGAPAVGRAFFDGTVEKHVIGLVADAHTEQYDRAQAAYYDAAEAAGAMLIRETPANVRRIREIITGIDADAVPTILSLDAPLRKQLLPALTGVGMAFAIGGVALALALATVGTFGVFAFMVAERTREIGVRVALGARARHVVSSVAARLVWPLSIGLVIGLTATQSLGTILRNQLSGVSARDPIVYVAVLVVLGTAGCLAMLGPARRARRVDPAVTLRHE
jgi:predicted permease